MVEITENEDHVLKIEDLTLEYTVSGKSVKALNHINLNIAPHESVGIVGESGCGKSTLAMAISHILPLNTRVKSGKIVFRGEVISDENLGASFSLRQDSKSKKVESALKHVRWKGISIVFQGALDSLNPLFTIGQQIDDIFIYKEKKTRENARKESKRILNSLGLDDWVLDAFPHQLSGGMKQRVIIAMAMTLHPVLIIADEPTTSLDVITQYKIIEELQKLRTDYKMSIINISHDISLVSHLSDRIMVMYAGRIVEKIPENSFARAEHPYTRMLADSIPSLAGKSTRLESIRGSPPSLVGEIKGCPFYERCDYAEESICTAPDAERLRETKRKHEVACSVLPFDGAEKKKKAEKPQVTVENKYVDRNRDVVVTFENVTREFEKRTGLRAKSLGARAKAEKIIAVNNVSFSLREGESLALVGETGSGKTTMSKIMGLLDQPTSGSISIKGERIAYGKKEDHKRFRKIVQTIFQDPFQSINPRHSVYQIVSEPMRVHEIYSREEDVDKEVSRALTTVELTPPEDYKNKFPHQLSGGQRQRVAMARSLILNPKIIIADEPISMLDVSMRAGILNLLKEMQSGNNVTLFYITHDIASARYVSNSIMVMYKGHIVESGETEQVITRPSHPYTIALILSSLGIEGKLETVLGPNIFSEMQEISSGCIFSNRCPLARPKCSSEEPVLSDMGDGHMAKCHYSSELLEHNRGNSDIVEETEAREIFSNTLKSVEQKIKNS